MDTMNSSNKPTRAQKDWLARVLGQAAWGELSGKPEFVEALESSISRARRIALRHLADKELNKRQEQALVIH
jgi:hypothetical protein